MTEINSRPTSACRAASWLATVRFAGVEACDDGNQADDDACRTNCELARCGDGIRRADRAEGEPGFEACDDGNRVE